MEETIKKSFGKAFRNLRELFDKDTPKEEIAARFFELGWKAVENMNNSISICLIKLTFFSPMLKYNPISLSLVFNIMMVIITVTTMKITNATRFTVSLVFASLSMIQLDLLYMSSMLSQ